MADKESKRQEEALRDADTKARTEAAFTKGQKAEEVVAKYDEWSKSYNEIMGEGRYNAPGVLLQEVLQQVPVDIRSTFRVLDVAAGTGRVGMDLWKEGFRHIDALEPSEGMLKKLRQSGVYTNEFLEFVGFGNSTVPKDTYDLVVCAGGMGEGHIPVKGIDDMVRAAKEGGLVIIAMREAFLESVEAYKDKLEPYMEELEKKGLWTKVTRKVVPKYFFDLSGVVFTYRVV